MGTSIVNSLNSPFPVGVQPLVIMDMMGGGQSQKVEPSVMALPLRPNFWFIIMCQWDPKISGPEGKDFAVNWCRTLWANLMKLSLEDCDNTEQVSIDTHGGEISEMIKATMLMGQQAKLKDVWGDNAAKMRQVKEKYDAENFFGSNIISE